MNKVYTAILLATMFSCGKQIEKQITEIEKIEAIADTQDYHIKELHNILSLGDSVIEKIQHEKHNQIHQKNKMLHEIEDAHHLVDVYRDSIITIERRPRKCEKCLLAKPYAIVKRDSIIYNEILVDTTVYITDTIRDTIIVTKKMLKNQYKKLKK